MTVTLFEHGEWRDKATSGLREMLIDYWNRRKDLYGDIEPEEDQEAAGLEIRKKTYQPFLRFDGDRFKARNYIGFIQSGDTLIEIYPKVFATEDEPDTKKKNLMFRHLLHWLGHCRKWRFPINQAGLDIRNVDSFPELFILIFAHEIHRAVSEQPYMAYQRVEEVLNSPKGSINFKRYINNGLARGNWHKLECDHEPFVYDNAVNRIIKHCAKLLAAQTGFPESLRLLRETLFILDEVEDTVCVSDDIEKVRLNVFFENYKSVLEICGMILDSCLHSNRRDSLSQWCVLFPMEEIFEGFAAGFIERKFSREWKVTTQASDMNFSGEPPAFKMRHDILLENKKIEEKKIILDTKYKLRGEITGPQWGVSQVDMYQMASYSLRRGCGDAALLYPCEADSGKASHSFNVESGFPGKDKITIRAEDIPFWTDEEENMEEKLDDKLRAALERVIKL